MSGHDWDNQPLAHEVPYWMRHKYNNALMIIARNEAEVKRLREQLQLAYEWVGLYEDTHMMDTFTMFLGDDEE